LKATVACGLARRFVVGNPEIQLLDVLAGVTVVRTASAEQLAQPGEVLVDRPTVEALQESLQLDTWREDPLTGELFAVVHDLLGAPERPEKTTELPFLEAEILRPWLLPAVFRGEQAGPRWFSWRGKPNKNLHVRGEKT
jgi:hypothetical protein